MFNKKNWLLGILFCFLFTSNGVSQDLNQIATDKYGSGDNLMLSFYQRYISGVRGAVCPMYPSCSQYAKIAFDTNNPLKAWFMATDRLMRCGHDLHLYPVIYKFNLKYKFDPLNGAAIPYKINEFILPEKQTSCWADSLFNNREYELAADEYKKLFYTFSNKDEYALKVAKSYYYGNFHEKLEDFYSKYIIRANNSQGTADSITSIQIKSYFKEARYSKSISLIRTLDTCDDEMNYIKGLNHFYLQNWELSKNAMSLISQTSKLYSPAQSFSSIEEDINNLPHRSPALAAVSSALIPGSGYAFSGKFQSVLSAMIINGLFAWISFEAYQKELYSLFTASAVIGFGWYIGSIRGAFIETQKWNNSHISNYKKIKSNQISIQ